MVAMEAVVVRHTDPIFVYSLMLACYFRATVARVRQNEMRQVPACHRYEVVHLMAEHEGL